MDTLSPKERSTRMGLVRSKDTGPEKLVRRIVWRLGFRYRLHVRSIPGTPDLVFRKQHKLIFIHGCFWHRHQSKRCKLARMPKSRINFWAPKLEANRRRDQKIRRDLAKAGWKVLTVWECELADVEKVQQRLRSFLE